MYKINDNYLKLPGSYLFSTIGKKVAAYKEANPDRDVISLGIGDVTLPMIIKREALILRWMKSLSVTVLKVTPGILLTFFHRIIPSL